MTDMKKLIFLTLAVAAGPAPAQSPPIPVFYSVEQDDRDGQQADRLVREVLARPAFALHARRDAGVLVVSRSSRVDKLGSDDKARDFSFTLTFYRDGGRLAESEETCLHNKTDDCADQIAADVTGADTIGR